MPQVQLTLGQERMRLSFAPGSESLQVSDIKEYGANIIDMLNDLESADLIANKTQAFSRYIISVANMMHEKSTNAAEIERLATLAMNCIRAARRKFLEAENRSWAMNEIECAAMWGVKLATFPIPNQEASKEA